MTREEKELAVEELQGCIIAEEHGKDGKPNGNVTCELTRDTINLAIKALKKEPTTKKNLEVDCISRAEMLKYQQYLHGKMPNEENHKLWEFIKELPSVTPQEPKWIPVSERLPNWDVDCLVVDEDGEYGVGYYREDAKAWDSPNWGWLERKDRVDNKESFATPCGIGKVIAWMPLPKPYREVEE